MNLGREGTVREEGKDGKFASSDFLGEQGASGDDLEGLSLRNRLIQVFDSLLPSANAAKVHHRHCPCVRVCVFANVLWFTPAP